MGRYVTTDLALAALCLPDRQESYRKTRQSLVAAFSFDGIGVAAAAPGLAYPVFAMVSSVTAALATASPENSSLARV